MTPANSSGSTPPTVGGCYEFNQSYLGSALIKVSHTEQKLGQAEREFVNQTASTTLLPIKRFLEGDMRTIQVLWEEDSCLTVAIQKERKVLNSKRLDLDACKSRLKKAKNVETQASVSSFLRGRDSRDNVTSLDQQQNGRRFYGGAGLSRCCKPWCFVECRPPKLIRTRLFPG